MVELLNAESSSPGAGPSLLVVADTWLMRLRATILLNEHGFTTLEPQSSKDVLNRYPSPAPAGLLLDGSSLDGQGIPLVQEIMALDPLVRVALLTSRLRREVVIDAARAGVRDLMAIPVANVRLIQAAHTLLTPPDRRRDRRVPVSLAARIGLGAAPGAYLPCRVDDLSNGGARVSFTDAPPEKLPDVGVVAHLRFSLPGYPGLILSVGHIVRSIPPNNSAVAFMHLSTAHRERIAAYCERLAATSSPS